MAGITANVSTVLEIMPPTIGAAMRLITSKPVPVLHMIGNRPAMMATTVIILGRTRAACGAACHFDIFPRMIKVNPTFILV